MTVAAIGQDNGLTPAIVLFSSNDVLFLSQSPNMSIMIKVQCTMMTHKLKLKTFTSEAVISIIILTEDLHFSIISPPVIVYIQILPCPPGYILSGNICDCALSLQDLATCNITNKAIMRKGYSWISPKWICPKWISPNYPSEQCRHETCRILVPTAYPDTV